MFLAIKFECIKINLDKLLKTKKVFKDLEILNFFTDIITVLEELTNVYNTHHLCITPATIAQNLYDDWKISIEGVLCLEVKKN